MEFFKPPHPYPAPSTEVSLRRYALFISHAWSYTPEYEGFVELIRPDNEFQWDNLSVPKTNPLQVFVELKKSYRCLVKQLDEAIRKAECLLVLAGMYAAHSGWIQSEIEAAKEFGVPILAIRPLGAERLPEAATHAATEEVGWNRKSVISAVRRHARGQDPFSRVTALLPPPDGFSG